MVLENRNPDGITQKQSIMEQDKQKWNIIHIRSGLRAGNKDGCSDCENGVQYCTSFGSFGVIKRNCGPVQGTGGNGGTGGEYEIRFR
jgi:hypothetical protein